MFKERKRILSSPEFRQSPQNQERNLLGLHIYATDVYRSSESFWHTIDYFSNTEVQFRVHCLFSHCLWYNNLKTECFGFMDNFLNISSSPFPKQYRANWCVLG